MITRYLFDFLPTLSPPPVLFSDFVVASRRLGGGLAAAWRRLGGGFAPALRRLAVASQQICKDFVAALQWIRTGFIR